ncbi:FHA domain-containing protein [Streptomyces sp. NPDC059063]|uniref:FHA domain-containing protein n=1 Tax=unclassified Streptomyces TaxID=2593676 RepID=UPI003695F34F
MHGGPGGPGAPGGPGDPGAGPGGPGGPGAPNPAQQFQQPPPTGPGGPGGPGGPPSAPGQDPFDYQGSRPSQVNRPAEPIPPFGGGSSTTPPPGGPAGPGGSGGPGAPQAFQQGPPAPPAFPRETGAPQGPPPGPGPAAPPTGGGDDWVLSPPSSEAPGQPQGFPGAGAPQAPATWTATVGPDRDYFMAMMQRSGPEAAGLNLPAYSPEQQYPLIGNQVTIGRRRHSTGDTPNIDLSVPPEDPGVSHQHAVLVQQPDGGWAVVDQNSTNGTTVNGGEEPIQPFVPVPLQDGDQVHVGAWTTITVRRD